MSEKLAPKAAGLMQPNRDAHEEMPVVWLTGASSGIGAELAKRLHARGYSLILSARKQDRLEALASELIGDDTTANRVSVVPCDVTRDSDVERVQKALAALTPRLDLVIANAGACEYIDFKNPDWSMMGRIAQVNFLGAVNTVQMAYPLLQATAKDGSRPHIVGVSSQALLMPFSRAEAYGASKAALHYFLQSLRLDMATYNIDVTSVLPGFVDTPMTAQNDFDMPFLMSAEEAAERIDRGIQKRPAVLAFPRRLYYLLRLFSFFPGLWFNKMRPKAKT